MDSKYLFESMELTEEFPSEEINLDGLPLNVKLQDGFTFKSKYNFENRHPYKIIYIPAVSYDEAVEFCESHNISTDYIEVDGNNVFIEYKENYKVKPISYIISCQLNQYEGNTINNTFNNFPVTISNLAVDNFSNKHILEKVKDIYDFTIPSNAGVTRESIHINYFVFEIQNEDE